MQNNKSTLQNNKKGSVLFVTVLAIAIGTVTISSILNLTFFSASICEKEIGNIKCVQAVKLSQRLYLTTIENDNDISESEIVALQKRIGGGAANNTIFGYSSDSTPSSIPGFRQINVTFSNFGYTKGTILQPPIDSTGFSYFEDLFEQKVSAILHDPIQDDVPGFRNKTKGTISEKNQLVIVPVFNMLAFYDRDLEFFAEEQGGFFSGRMHTNGNLFLTNLNKMNGTEMYFHSVEGYSFLSAHGYALRRGRGGLASTYWPADGNSAGGINRDAQEGIIFNVHNQTAYDNILDQSTWNVADPSSLSMITSRILRPDYTSSAINAEPQNSSYTPTLAESNRRRHAENSDSAGSRISLNSVDSSEPSFALTSTSGDNYSIISFQSDYLSPPVEISPYQYIEDIQYQDTPDTINYASPIPSNYQEDLAAKEALIANALNSRASLYIRDGVAYQRTTPGGNLTKVQGSMAYPDPTHAKAKVYSDLRWYGWFGMNDGVSPSADNPARWHFPLKSVTFNATKDNNNVATAPTSNEGTAIAFTFKSSTIHNPVNDGVSSGTSDWIKTYDLSYNSNSANPFNSLPQININTATNNEGDGVGMWKNNYPNISSANGIERYDPVRYAYNIVKAEVRKIYNQHHIYTSRHNGVRMLNRDGSLPTLNTAPDVWGADMDDSFGIDYDNDDNDLTDTTSRNYSAFWNDDGAQTTIGPVRHIRFLMKANSGHPSHTRTAEIEFKTTSGDTVPAAAGDVVHVSDLPDPSAKYACNESSSQNSNTTSSDAFDKVDSSSSVWQTGPHDTVDQWLSISALDTADFIDPTSIKLTMENNNADTAPSHMIIQYTNVLNPVESDWIDLKEIHYNWAGGSEMVTFDLCVPQLFKYLRDDTSSTHAIKGILNVNGNADTTPKVELFPIRHKSLSSAATGGTFADDADSNNNWYIYKSTLPLSNRTLPMPESRNWLDGWNYNTHSFMPENRLKNFGFCNKPQGKHNWFVLLNNASEMLVRQQDIEHEVPETGFSYYAGDAGGYYGNDNLCMIDQQEKKITVFTELDMAEFTKECFVFNNLVNNFATNTAKVRDTASLQNIVYIVNTTMGSNFYGKRVHCGAVRIKRGRIFDFPLSIASPNSIYVWGDYNSPGYNHHGPMLSNTVGNIVKYSVPSSREHQPNVTITTQPSAIYADAVQIIENNWIPFDQTNTAKDRITDKDYGSLFSGTVNWNLGYTNPKLSSSCIWPSNPSGHNFQENNGTYLSFLNGAIFDHELWWEDDGLRRAGGGAGGGWNGMQNIYLPVYGSSDGTLGSQLFLNYHALHFNDGDNQLTRNLLQRYEAGGNPIMKLMPQCIIGGFFYGNVEGRSPSAFKQTDFDNIPVSRPSSVQLLDWLTSWIPRTDWVELTSDNLKDLNPDSGIGNNSVSESELPFSSVVNYYLPSNLSTGNFYGFNANGYVEDRYEILKKRFGNIGFKLDIRSMHTYHWPAFDTWNNNSQNYTRNFIGAFSCLYDSRQATHEQREKDNSWEGRSMYCFNPNFENMDGLPPGTPLVTSLNNSERLVGGTKWEY